MTTDLMNITTAGHWNRSLKALAWLNLLVCLGLFGAAVGLYFANQPAPVWRLTLDLEV